MRLTNSKGDVFELKIIGYQFPHHEDHEYDSNWLQVQIQCRLNGHTWIANDPCLLTWEMEGLLKWFKKVGNRELVRRMRWSFLEPYLSFKLVSAVEGQKLWVCLQQYYRPSWAYLPYIDFDDDDFHLEFPVSEVSFDQVINSLQAQLQKFPIRAEHLVNRRHFKFHEP
jgi:hypothetical protein